MPSTVPVIVSESRPAALAIPKSATRRPPSLVEQQVPRLDVAMDDAVPVRGVERRRRLLEPVERLVRRRRPAVAQPVLERAAVEVLHDDERPARPLADVEDRDRVRLAGEARCRERLAREPLPERFVPRVPLGEHLDRDGAAERPRPRRGRSRPCRRSRSASGCGSGAAGCRSERSCCGPSSIP